MNPASPRNFTHDAAQPAVLVLLKDGMIQKTILYGCPAMVYVREEGRGGFGVVPTEIATDFLAFDDMLTLEPEQIASEQHQATTENNGVVASNGTAVLAITVKSQISG